MDSLTVEPRFVANAGIFAGLGLDVVQHPAGVGEHLAVDEMGAAAVDGAWAAGNVANLMLQVLPAAASGSTAAMAINNDLMAEELQRDLMAYRGASTIATDREAGTMGAEVSR